jgi:hypothetical protein
MNAEMLERMREALIRRALGEASLKEHRGEEDLCIRDTLGALEEITTLTRGELETIASEVRRSYKGKEDTFFSITHQILLTSALAGFISCVPILGIWLF